MVINFGRRHLRRPRHVVDTLLSELSLSAWVPLRQAATQIRTAARFDRNDRRDAADIPPAVAVEEALRLAGSLTKGPEDEGPLAALDRLHRAAAAAPLFAPAERARLLLPLPSGTIAFEPARSGMPLWAPDLAAGPPIAMHARDQPPPLARCRARRSATARIVAARAGHLVAEAAGKAVQRLIECLEAAHATVRDMQVRRIDSKSSPESFR